MNITIIGHVCIDNNISEHTTYTTAGSPAMFMEKVYRRFSDTTVHILSPYGIDFIPYLKNIHIYPNKPVHDWTLIYENKSNGMKRTQKALNREYAKPIPIDNAAKKIISQSDVLFFAPLTPDYSAPYVEHVMRFIQSDSLKILLPQGYYRSFDDENNVLERNFIEAESLLRFFDFIIVSEQDHQDMKTIARKWAENIQVLMTLGEKGAAYYYKNELFTVPVKKVKIKDIVDSVGSGDIFSASFGYKYYLTKNIKKSLEFANIIARQCLFSPADDLRFLPPSW